MYKVIISNNDHDVHGGRGGHGDGHDGDRDGHDVHGDHGGLHHDENYGLLLEIQPDLSQLLSYLQHGFLEVSLSAFLLT